MNYYFSRLFRDKRSYIFLAVLLFMVFADFYLMEKSFGRQYSAPHSTFLPARSEGHVMQLMLYLFFPFGLLFSYAGWNTKDIKTGNFVLTLTRKGKIRRILGEVFAVGSASFLFSAIPLLANLGLVFLIKGDYEGETMSLTRGMLSEEIPAYLASLAGREKQLYDYTNWEYDHPLLDNFIHILLFCLVFSCMAVIIVLLCILLRKIVVTVLVLAVYWVGLMLSSYSLGNTFMPFAQVYLFSEKLLPVIFIGVTMLVLLGITLKVVKKRDELY